MNKTIVRLCLVAAGCVGGLLAFVVLQSVAGYRRSAPGEVQNLIVASFVFGPSILGALFVGKVSIFGLVMRLLTAGTLLIIFWLMLTFLQANENVIMTLIFKAGDVDYPLSIIEVLGAPILVAVSVGILVAPDVISLVGSVRKLLRRGTSGPDVNQ